MFKRQLLILTALSMALSTVSWAQDEGVDEEEAVKITFSAYKAAIIEGRGEDAVERLSKATIDYYGQMRDLALYATEKELRGQTPINIYQALTLRHRIEAGKLAEMSGHDVLIHSIAEGWIGKNAVSNIDPGDVSVAGETASMEMLGLGQRTGEYFEFHKEDGAWRLNLVSAIERSNAQFEAAAKQQGITADVMVLKLVGAQSGKEVPATIWQPPLERKKKQAPANQ